MELLRWLSGKREISGSGGVKKKIELAVDDALEYYPVRNTREPTEEEVAKLEGFLRAISSVLLSGEVVVFDNPLFVTAHWKYSNAATRGDLPKIKSIAYDQQHHLVVLEYSKPDRSTGKSAVRADNLESFTILDTTEKHTFDRE